jgi:hypothetical protein
MAERDAWKVISIAAQSAYLILCSQVHVELTARSYLLCTARRGTISVKLTAGVPMIVQLVRTPDEGMCAGPGPASALRMYHFASQADISKRYMYAQQASHCNLFLIRHECKWI